MHNFFTIWLDYYEFSVDRGLSPFFKGGIQLASCLRQKLHCLRKTFLTAVSDNMRPALSKTFQDFGFFFDVNQTVTIAINP